MQFDHLTRGNRLFAVASFLFGGASDSEIKRVLDFIPARIAVVDGTGDLRLVNTAWRATTWRDGGPSFDRGMNYLDLCTAQHGVNAVPACTIARGLRSVLTGETPSFRASVTWSVGQENKVFLCVITPWEREGEGTPTGAVILHVDMPDERNMSEEEISRDRGAATGPTRQNADEKSQTKSDITENLPLQILPGTTDWIPAMVGYVDADLVCRAANGRYAEWFGVPVEKIVGMPLSEITGTALFRRLEDPVHQVLAGKEVCFEDVFEPATGQPRWFRATYIPDCNREGQARGFSSLAYDITLLKEMETRLEAARQTVEQCRRVHNTFLEHVGHELKSSLTSIIGFAEPLATELFGPIDTRYREYSCDIRDTASALVDLVNDLADLARIQAGQFQLDEERIDLHTLLTNGLGRAEQTARDAGIRLHKAIPDHISPLFADERLVRQVVLNMLNTIIALTADGGHVYLLARREKDGLALRVADPEVHLDEDFLARLLEPFGRCDFPPRLFAGLALPLAHHYMDLHGGTLRVTSDPKAGLAIVATFPPARVVA
ncbi:MAG: Signal transduction histidine kinase [Rhodospirillaceae bacterium]|nr:MAG: Signal transduction histidine kinase [Rhodospirillaceae bacterium]